MTPSVGMRDSYCGSRQGWLCVLKAFAAGSEFLPCPSMTFPAGCELNLSQTLRALVVPDNRSKWNLITPLQVQLIEWAVSRRIVAEMVLSRAG